MNPSDFLHEAARQLPVIHDCDVIVCGAGPAGIGAALASARAGADTTLIEVHGCLGGVWTAGNLSWVIDAHNKGGIMAELAAKLESLGARSEKNRCFTYDVEKMKVLLDRLCSEAGVRVQLHTRVCAASVRDGVLDGIITESKSGREAWRAGVFVDATGDGDLAAQAGCGFDLGHPETGECQPMSLIGLVSGLRASEIEPFIGGGEWEPKKNLAAEIARAGLFPSYSLPILFRIYDDLFALIANHEYGVSAIDAGAISAATINAREETLAIVEGLRSLGGPWKDMRLVSTGSQIGVREGRRIHGLYTVTVDDAIAGVRHSDAICRVTFGIDVHSTNPAYGKAMDEVNKTRTQPYDIPARALVARDVDGLLLSGRCISGDFLAHSSYRVTGNAVALGEAAGKIAAYCIKNKTSPHRIDLLKDFASLQISSNVDSHHAA